MTEANEVEELRQLISHWRGSGTRFATEALRERVAVYAAERVKRGISRRAVADEVGLKEATLTWWLQRREKVKLKKPRGKRGVFQRVQVVAAERQHEVVAYGPRGLRIEGLSVDDVAALVLKLS